jgi:KDO2-lipid IV(A) lauroyltransferase
MIWQDSFKTAKRNARYVLLKGVVDLIAAQPVTKLDRLKRLLLKVMPVFFAREMKRAGELLPAEFAPRKAEILRGMQEHQVLNLLEVILYDRLLQNFPDYIETEGEDVLKSVMAKGKGGIILSAHFGNWELVGYTLARLGYPIHAIARPQAVNRMTEFMNGFRASRGVNVLMDNNLSASLKLLKENALVGIVSDLNARERGYQTTFFGRTASFYPTPVILSLRSGAPLIPTFIERESLKKHRLRFEIPIEWPPGETMPERVRRYVERYENGFRRRPDHWVWFHERYAHAELGRTR